MKVPRRGDALRSRRLLLQAAAESLSGGGGPSDLHSEIARRTGFGRSTVYRRIGSRQEIYAAVIHAMLDPLHDASARVQDGELAFRDLLELLLSTQALMHPLAVMGRELPEEEQYEFAAVVTEALRPAFEHAQATGQIDPAADPDDLRVVMAMLLTAQAESASPGQVGRMLRLLVDGTVLPGADVEDPLETERGRPSA